MHPYLEGRYDEISKGLYPKHHLWGVDTISNVDTWQTEKINTQNINLPTILEQLLNRTFFRGSPGVKAELAAWRKGASCDLIYSVCGPLALARYYKKARLVSWVFRKPDNLPTSNYSNYGRKNLNSHGGFLCLTPNAKRAFSEHGNSMFLPWCVDLDLFDGKPPDEIPNKPFFLATGKTGRDYDTLLKAAQFTKAEIRIIGPKFQKPNTIRKNVTWIDTSSNPPDQAIDYPTLKKWYAQSSGVCIPLSGDADDTCGYTNMLEGMAMRKPVVMTRSGCLHFDPSSRNFGILVEPGDSQGWSDAMNRILNDENFASECGENGRKIALEEFSIERFNRDVLSFINEVIELNDRN